MRIATWLPIVPERTNRAASFPVMDVRSFSRELVVGSSWNTSSARVVATIASSMRALGVVIVSPWKYC